MTNIDAEIGRRLTGVRQAAGCTVHELAGRIGTTELELLALEAGAFRFGAERLFRLAQALDTEVRWFFEDHDPVSARSDVACLNELSILKNVRANKSLSDLCDALRAHDDEDILRRRAG